MAAAMMQAVWTASRGGNRARKRGTALEAWRGAEAIAAPRPTIQAAARRRLSRRASRLFATIAAAATLAGCATMEASPRPSPQQAAAAAGFERELITTPSFTLFSLQRTPSDAVDTVHVYLEGDGYAWARPSRPSTNPTPRNPVALSLAVRDPARAVAYLARPCQYVDISAEPLCERAVWTLDRYAPPEITAVDAAIETIKRQSGAQRVGLNGYSGAGAILAVLADRRSDVAYIRTVAANLDPAAFTTHHGVTPFRRAVDARSSLERIEHVPQRHYVGRRDWVAPPTLVRAAVGPDRPCLEVITLEAAHEGPWSFSPEELAARPRCVDIGAASP